MTDLEVTGGRVDGGIETDYLSMASMSPHDWSFAEKSSYIEELFKNSSKYVSGIATCRLSEDYEETHMVQWDRQ